MPVLAPHEWQETGVSRFDIPYWRIKQAREHNTLYTALSILHRLRNEGDEAAILGDFKAAFSAYDCFQRFKRTLQQQLQPNADLVENDAGAFCIKTRERHPWDFTTT